MTFNLYLTQNMVATRHTEIQRTMQQSRKQAQAAQPGVSAHATMDKLGNLLPKRAPRLQHSEVYS